MAMNDNKDNNRGLYDDIIHLPRHVSTKHRPMSMRDRAAQFAPFAALTGHGAAINETARLTDGMVELSEEEKNLLDMKQQTLLELRHLHPEVTVTYFCPDEFKSGGAYLSVTGTVKEIDNIQRLVIMSGGEQIPADCIVALESRVFDERF